MHISTSRLGIAAAVCAAAALTATALAGTADGSSDRVGVPVAGATPVVTPRLTNPGSTFVVSGKGCRTTNNWTTGVELTLTRKGRDWATASAGHGDITSGAWTVRLRVPATAPAGRYAILSTCDQYQDSFVYPSVPVTIVAAQATAIHADGPQDAIDFASTTAVTAQLLSGRAPVRGATMSLLGRPAGARSFGVVTTRTTDGHGRVRANVHPMVRTVYKWAFAGTTALQSSTSAPTTVAVARVVDAQSSRRSVTSGSPIVVYGTVAPATTGLGVTLQQYARHRWSTVDTAVLRRQKLPDGERTLGFVTSLTPGRRGTYLLRVAVAGTGGLEYSASPTVRVTVRS